MRGLIAYERTRERESDSMSSTIHRRAIVGPDRYLHIPVPELEPGTEVEVTIVQSLAEEDTGKHPAPKLQLSDLFGTGRGLFATPEEADAFIREGRGPWPD